jgi:hypothetical protein
MLHLMLVFNINIRSSLFKATSFYFFILERVDRIELTSQAWKASVITIIRYSRFGWNQTSSVHRDLVVDFHQSVPRHRRRPLADLTVCFEVLLSREPDSNWRALFRS